MGDIQKFQKERIGAGEGDSKAAPRKVTSIVLEKWEHIDREVLR